MSNDPVVGPNPHTLFTLMVHGQALSLTLFFAVQQKMSKGEERIGSKTKIL